MTDTHPREITDNGTLNFSDFVIRHINTSESQRLAGVVNEIQNQVGADANVTDMLNLMDKFSTVIGLCVQLDSIETSHGNDNNEFKKLNNQLQESKQAVINIFKQ